MRSFILATTSVIALAVTPASAQVDQTVAPSAEATADDGAQLEEIVVTAQRRSENLQRTAVAVDAVGGDDLLKAGVTTTGRLQELVPALTIEPTSSGNLIFIRGVGNFTLTNNSDPATAFTYDEVYVGRPIASFGVFYDLERVEVLKGPQGTLYGRNATGGAINVIPVKPKPGEFSGYGSLSYGNYDAVTAEAAVNVPLGEDGAMRVSGSYAKRDGYLRDGSSDEDTKAIRLQLLGNLTPNLTVRTNLDYAHQGGVGEGVTYLNRIVLNPATGTYSSISSGLSMSEGVFSPAAQAFRTTLIYPTIGAAATPLSVMQFQNNDYFGAHANIAWDTGVGTLTVIPAWRYALINNVSGAGFTARGLTATEQESVEARFDSDRFSLFEATAGLLYFDEAIQQKNSRTFIETAETFTRQRFETTSKAIYGRLTAHLTDRLRLTGGIRYTDDAKETAGSTDSLVIQCARRVNNIPACPTTPLLRFTNSLAQQALVPPLLGVPVPLGTSGSVLIRANSVIAAQVDNDEVTWRGAAEFDLSPESFAYASVETGYRSGGFNPVGEQPYQPEYITAYTVGLKNRFLNNRVRLNLEGFVWKYRDQQVSHPAINAAGRPVNITDNIGEATMKGVEMELTALATPTTLLSADVQYLDAEYDSFLFQPPVASGLPYNGCPTRVSPTNPLVYEVNCTGFPVYNSPKWTLNLAAQQTVELGDYDLTFSADTQYRSGRFIFFEYQPEQYVGSTWRSNAQVSFGPADDGWSVGAFVRNIENDRIPLFAPQQPALATLTVQVSAPRTYGVRASMKF